MSAGVWAPARLDTSTLRSRVAGTTEGLGSSNCPVTPWKGTSPWAQAWYGQKNWTFALRLSRLAAVGQPGHSSRLPLWRQLGQERLPEEVGASHRNKILRTLLGHGSTCLESWRWENQGLWSSWATFSVGGQPELHEKTQSVEKEEEKETEKKKSLETGRRVRRR